MDTPTHSRRIISWNPDQAGTNRRTREYPDHLPDGCPAARRTARSRGDTFIESMMSCMDPQHGFEERMCATLDEILKELKRLNAKVDTLIEESEPGAHFKA
jgi:hypothetical protein